MLSCGLWGRRLERVRGPLVTGDLSISLISGCMEAGDSCLASYFVANLEADLLADKLPDGFVSSDIAKDLAIDFASDLASEKDMQLDGAVTLSE